MSKVKIQGNASGTGVLTVTAPNTSTDRTITLPDETATLSTFNPDGAVTINESGADVDFRVESDNLTHALFVQGSTGEVGIRTNSPTAGYSLHVGPASGVHTKVKIEATTATGQAELDLSADPAGVSYLNLGDENSYNIGRIGYFHSDDSMRFRTNGSERMRILAGGGLTFNGDTAAANALDAYEEGTWTPTLPQGGTITTVNNAVYTKVGNVVSFQLYANNISITNNSSEFQIGGLPFQPMNSPNTYGGGQVGYVGGFNWAQYEPSMLINPGGSKIYWQRLNGTSSPVTQSNLQGLTVIILSGVYHTNS